MLMIWRGGGSQVATGLGSAAQDPCAVPHRFYLSSCLASRTADGRPHVTGHGFLNQPHPRWLHEHFIRLQRICILAIEGAQSPAEGIISHLEGVNKLQHNAERPAVSKF